MSITRRNLLAGAAIASVAIPGLRADNHSARYVRYRQGKKQAYGELEDDTIYPLDGSLLKTKKRSGDKVALSDVKLLYPVRSPKVFAVGTGRVLRACVEQLPPMDCPQHHLVSLVGNTMTDGSATAYNVVVRMAERVGGRHNPMPLPVLVRNPAELPILHSQEPVAKTLALCAGADATFVGIGHIDGSAPLTVDGFITHEESRALIRLGAAGEIVGWVFDARGRLIEGLTNDRVSSAPLVPANARPVIGLAVGELKVAAILGALRGRLINTLVTDEATAEAILA